MKKSDCSSVQIVYERDDRGYPGYNGLFVAVIHNIIFNFKLLQLHKHRSAVFGKGDGNILLSHLDCTFVI